MTKPKSKSTNSPSFSRSANRQSKIDAKRRLRGLLLENLEARRLLTVGPQLLGVQPNASDLLADGAVRTESPSELTFRFDQNQAIDSSTLEGIRLTQSGGDGTFGLATLESDFGSGGAATILLTADFSESAYQIQVVDQVMAAGEPPQVARTGTTVTITLNTNPSSPTTAAELINAINSSSHLIGQFSARLSGGVLEAELGTFAASDYSPLTLIDSNDEIITPGAALVGEGSSQNEVTLRFAQQLKDDSYRLEVFGFDDPILGITGLRNESGEFFQPTTDGTRKDTIDFRLDLGPQVVSVIPQPVVRVNGQLEQQRDTVLVYFDDDKMFVSNDGLGQPAQQSVENPAFYKLIYTADTVRNTDDVFEIPTNVDYNAATNSVTLTFRDDIERLAGSEGSTFRLRIGTRETAPVAPVVSEAAATAISDFNTGGQVKFRFTSLELGETGGGVQIDVVNSNSGSPPAITASGKRIQIDLGSDSVTAGELLSALQTSSASGNLVSVRLEPGSDPSTVLDAPISYSPISVVGLGSSFDTSTDLGLIGSQTQSQTSLILSSAIDAKPFELDLPGASDDAAHRELPQNSNDFEGHVNEAFGADSTDGISTIYYNFRQEYATDSQGVPLTNAITEELADRTREVLGLWANYIGVQFVETAESGVTFALGQESGLLPRPDTQVREYFSDPAFGIDGLDFGVRIDPTFNESLVVMSADTNWGTEYGDDYTRTLAAAVGMILGLEHAGDLPETTLLRLDPRFLGGSEPLVDDNDTQLTASDERFEPVFPGNQDILHAQYLYRPDSIDVDLYRFEVDFGGTDQVGLFTAETYAQRLPNSSALNTNLELFRQTQASAKTNLGGSGGLQFEFEAVADGPLGNQLQILLTQTERNDSSEPRIQVFPNLIAVDLNSNPNMLTTAQQFVDAMADSSAASRLVRVSLSAGDSTATIGDNSLTQNPIVLTGGGIELVSQNDDYFSEDSLLKQSLTSGVYYIGVSASGNNEYTGTLEDGGFGGQSQGDYDLQITFRAAVDTQDALQDIDGPGEEGSVIFDGDSDGVPGGSYDFWFQTQPLNRVLDFVGPASADMEGTTLTFTGGNGVTRTFEFDSDGLTSPGRIGIPYSSTDSASVLAGRVASAINARGELGISATRNGISLELVGERLVDVDDGLVQIEIQGKTIFVDKSAATNADGSLENPFNNISNPGVPNAFAATHPGDIVRIVGNGGIDGDLATVEDNLAYEIGVGLLPGSTLSDGVSMDVPNGVTTMIDAGAVLKFRQAAINVGSTNLSVDRSASALQVLGAPVLVDVDGNAMRNADGSFASGRVYFTSWLDESIGFDSYSPTTTPAPGDWGGISLQRSVDRAAGRSDLEDEGIFLRYINHADIRYGGGTVVTDAVQSTVNSIQMLDTRATVTDNIIQFGADAALSALPNSFEETNFNEPRFQAAGRFTSDYERVGPLILRNQLINNSLNGLFIRVDTPADGATQTLTVPGRFDDTSVVHLISENLVVTGQPGGAILDNTSPDVDLVSLAGTGGGSLPVGTYSYKLTFVDRNGYESIPSNPTVDFDLDPSSNAIRLAGLPGATGDFVSRKLYRSNPTGSGPYELIATLDKSTSDYIDAGGSLGGTLNRDRADIREVTLTDLGADTGTLAAGTYRYRVVMVDAAGREGLASVATDAINVEDNSSVRLDQIPATLAGYSSRRIYRSADSGTAPYTLVGTLTGSDTSFTDTGAASTQLLSEESLGVRRPRINASLVIDPGSVLKLESARIEATFGANLIAEGVDGVPIVFTSRHDDTVGAGGTFDTNNNGSSTSPEPRNWGGLYLAPTSSLSVDYARFAYGGGVTKIDGTFRAFNTIEIQQADARIANSLFENNADGFGGQGPGTRFGRLSNAQSTIFVRGSQPTIVGNTFVNNAGSAIEIDVLSMDAELRGDPGRQTGFADQNPEYSANRGPLIRDNRFDGNDLNGLEIRAADILTTASVWDDTDIVHVVTEEIFVGNVQHEGGLRLQSATSESLVVKFDGYGSNFNDNLGAGLTANGQLTSSLDRVGGTIQIAGQPGFPVILTSLFDDTVGAGLKPDGTPQSDTNNDGINSVPQAGDWRGLFFDQYANDRNVILSLETEDFNAAAPGPNGQVSTSQVLGDLAGDASGSSENRSLGFVVEGVLSQTADVDVFSFTGEAGSEVWLDVDHTSRELDLVLELLDANGVLLARSDNSTEEADDPSLIFQSPLLGNGSANPLVRHLENATLTSSGAVKEDGTTNPLDPGMRVRLPGAVGSRSTFYFRVRSAGTNIDDTEAGLTSGSYQVQVRLQEGQEWAGSSVNYADIRYATNGLHLKGLPSESPLIGEAQEDESTRDGLFYANNGVATGDGRTGVFFSADNPLIVVDRQEGNRPQYLGNLLESNLGGFSVAGEIASPTDLDFYMIEVQQDDIVDSVNGLASVVFDIDYADGLNRPDTTLNIFRQEPSDNPFFDFQYRLVYSGDNSNIAEDQSRPLAGTDVEDLSRGSVGTKDAYVGPVALQQGTYLVGVSAASYVPRTTQIYPYGIEPINSIQRIVDEGFVAGQTSATPPVVPDFLDRTDVGAELVSKTFDLSEYGAEDLPGIYLDYTHTVGDFEVFVRDAEGTETLVATSAAAAAPVTVLPVGDREIKIPLASSAWNFAGEDGLSLVFRSTDASTNIDNIVIGFAERGESLAVANNESLLLNSAFLGQASFQQTREFSLESYTFADAPSLEFTYQITDGDLEVFLVNVDGTQIQLATSDGNAPNLFDDELISETIQLPFFAAGQDGWSILFQTQDDDPTSVFVQNVHISLADGARIHSGEPNPTYIQIPSSQNAIESGKYQLEVRLAENYFESRGNNAFLTQSFDTNDRFAEQLTITAPSGLDIVDGDIFEISDGRATVVFEFSTDNTVGLGNILVPFAATDEAHQVAEEMIRRINSSNVQSRLLVRAATTTGEFVSTNGESIVGRDASINLFGDATISLEPGSNLDGKLAIKLHAGHSDQNLTREQSVVHIANSYFRESRDYGIWSEAAEREFDPRDVNSVDAGFFGGEIPHADLQDKPNLVGVQAIRNLPVINEGVQGGYLPGLVIENNVLEEGGLGGISVQGETPIWILSTDVPYFRDDGQTDPADFSADFNPFVNNQGVDPPPSHFGHYIDDADTLIVDVDRTRLNFEFDDLAGGAVGLPVAGSGQVEGDGYRESSTVAWYRDTGGDFYRRSQGGQLQPFATTALETVHALRDSILGSILVTNGSTQTITATVASSLLGPDPDAPEVSPFASFIPDTITGELELTSYGLYHNRPALYLEGVSNLAWQDGPNGYGFNPFDTRQLDLGETPQPNPRIVNNTIIGTDGRASFNGESPISEDNDTISDAVQTWQGTSHNPLFYSDVGIIGDGGPPIVGALGGSASAGGNNQGGGDGGNGASFNASNVIIKLDPDMTEEQRNQFLADQELTFVKSFDFIGAMLVESNRLDNIQNRANQLSALPNVVYAEPDYVGELSLAPNDPQYPLQWHYDNTGQTGGTPDADIDLPEAWDSFTGSEEVVIAVLDSGIDYNHADLAANLWVNPGEIPGDGIDNDLNGYVDDIYGIDPADGDSDPIDTQGHGTHVAGTTAAATNNGTGVSGVNWNSKIMALKIGPDNSRAVFFSAAIESLQYMVTMKTQYGVNIVVSNNSYGGPGASQAFSDAIQASIDVGIPFVAAAGNSGFDNDQFPNFPSNFPLDGIIAVAASDHNDELANFTQFGATSVDLAAPGVDILSTTLGGGYGLNSGTSMASPHVAGVVALLAGSNPDATVAELKSAVLLGADPIPGMEGTTVTGARLNAAKSLLVLNAGNGILSSTDVDIYQFKLGVGERVIVDVDSADSGLDSVLQIFDSRGVAQEFSNASGSQLLISDNDAAPTEVLALDPYADFTATEPGVYYAAVSSAGNESYDPRSLAGRTAGETTGAYRITISARHLQDFVITAQDASQYQNGETFTIFGVPDIDSTGDSGRTFEFVFGLGGASDPDNIPINIDPDWRFPDVAVAIAKAINEGGANRGPAITNEQRLDNGSLGLASPLPPVYARALGGLSGIIHAPFNDLDGDKDVLIKLLGSADGLGFDHMPDRELERILSGPFWEVNQGLELFPRRLDGDILTVTTSIPDGTFTNIHTLGHLGIGHDRESTQPLSFTSRGDGASEKFIVVQNAAWIDGNDTVIVDPDEGVNNNLDQLLPETGVLASRGASATVLNNVFFNLQTPVIAAESRVNENTGAPEPYGTDNPNVITKPGEVVIGGSIYQYYESGIANLRFGTGIEEVPTNVPNTGLDLNFDVPDGETLFVNAQAGEFLPAPGSPLIDSAIDSLDEPPSLTATKLAVGIPPAPILAPTFDLVGQLRADDPDVAPPGGLGQNVFKDRGALDRADFTGPSAILLDPLDNDSLGIDQDGAVSVVELNEGVYPEFRIQLLDGNEPSNPLLGLGIDDDSVVNSILEGLRAPGASLVIFENGRLLSEGIDYSFSYNETRDEIILTPLAGVWKQGAIYDISLNNKDRFALVAPSGDQVADGDIFTIVDSLGGVSYFEFESGYQLQVPQALSLNIPVAGGGNGGIVDSDRFTIIAPNGSQHTFEFDNNGNTLGQNRAIAFEYGDSQQRIAELVVAAIETSDLQVSATIVGAQVVLGAESGTLLDTTFSATDQPAGTLALSIPTLGPRPGGITDGQRFTVSDGVQSVTFEYDADGILQPGSTPIDLSVAFDAGDVTAQTLIALRDSELNLNLTSLSDQLIHLGLGPSGSVDTSQSNLLVFGVSRALTDGQSFAITTAQGNAVFEFDNDGSVASGNVAVPILQSDLADDLGDRIADAIRDAALGLSPIHVGGGNVAIGGEIGDRVNVANAASLLLSGRPSVESGTELQVIGPLLLNAPPTGGGSIPDDSTFSITNADQVVTFEFDSNFSGASSPNNVLIAFDPLDSQQVIADKIVVAINNATLGINAQRSGNGGVSLGALATDQVDVNDSNLTLSRDLISDGEFFTISNTTTSATFEFENAGINNGFDPTRIPIFYTSSTTADELVAAMRAAIEGAGLGLSPTALPGGVLRLNDSAQYTTDLSGAPTMGLSGVPGGAVAVNFIRDPSFTGSDMKQAILDAIRLASDTSLIAKDRGAETLFVENAVSISSNLQSYFLKGISDLAGNLLRPNRINNETQFTILMPGIALDYGDAPDPFTTTSGRYPTERINDGARHVVSETALLGSTITAESDGQPTPAADGDADDGVTFGETLGSAGIFNRNIFTSIDVTLASPGFVDAWIDFNADGDWDDPGEQILDSARFTAIDLTQQFQVTVPATAPIPGSPTTTFARFRSSSAGGLIPTGLANDGEVEDYAVTIVPGFPPVAVDDNYTLNEDSSLTTTDADGNGTPSFTIDDGVAANDQDVDSTALEVIVIDPPQNAASFSINDDGTFTYVPNPNFNGTDTFTYRVNDGILESVNVGTVTITVAEVNDTPVAQDDSLTIDEDEVLDIDSADLTSNDAPAADASEDDQELIITAVDSVSSQGGTVALQQGRVIYTPPTNFSGTDTFAYTVTDNGTTGGVAAPLSTTATVTITVDDKNDAPIAGGDALTTAEDTDGTIAISTLLANDSPGPADEAGQEVVFKSVDSTSTNGGTIVVNGDDIVYTPPADFVGTDTFVYTIEDNGTSGGVPDPEEGQGTVTVTVTPINDDPRVQTALGELTMLEDDPTRVIDLSSIFFDPDVATNGDQLTYTIVTNSNATLVTPTVNGSQLELQLTADQNGEAVIEVRATDLAGASITDTLTLKVTPVNDAPRLAEALPDLSVNEDGNNPSLDLSPQYFFDPDVDLNGDTLTFTVISNSNPILVTPIVNGDVLSLSLNPNQSGTAVISVRATDDSGQEITDTFNLVVNPIDDPPVTTEDSYSVARGETLITTDPQGLIGGPENDGVLANDSDPEGGNLTAVLVTEPSFASVFALNANGTFTYGHDFAEGQVTDTFTYRASDGNGQSVETTVTITIGAPPPPPHQNPVENLDVNADGFVTPIDALLVVNFLNTNDGDGSVANLPPPPPFRDTNGDNFITAIDALLVINALNNQSGGGGGEGEAFVDYAGAFPVEGFQNNSIDVGHSSDNERIGMRVADRGEMVYGPARQLENEVFGSDQSLFEDTSWVASEDDEEQPIDAALESLLNEDLL